jgi:hypothetical protein
VSRRVRWFWLAGLATSLWTNRRDVARWARFARRSSTRRDRGDLASWMTEARVRAAISLDPMLRRDPSLDDVVVEDGRVSIRTASATWPDVATHVNGLRKVKGVADVRCEPGRLIGDVPVPADDVATV